MAQTLSLVRLEQLAAGVVRHCLRLLLGVVDQVAVAAMPPKMLVAQEILPFVVHLKEMQGVTEPLPRTTAAGVGVVPGVLAQTALELSVETEAQGFLILFLGRLLDTLEGAVDQRLLAVRQEPQLTAAAQDEQIALLLASPEQTDVEAVEAVDQE